MTALHNLSVAEAGRALRARRISAEELTAHALRRIAAHDGMLGAFIRVTEDLALDQARAADRAFACGQDLGPLQGIPYGLKDLFDVRGVPTTCNSWLTRGHRARADSAVAERLSAGGAVLLGKLNLHEFATGGSGRGLPHRAARNPWDPRRATGGSSSGGSVAVAARFARVTIGSDTGGSLRQPAAYCGGVGLKPTYGRVSRFGGFPLSPTLDHCGPLTASVEDATLTLQAIAGFDARDPASLDAPVEDYAAVLRAGVAGFRVAMPLGHFGLEPQIDPSVRAALAGAAEALRAAGARVELAEFPPYDAFAAAGMPIMLAEAFAHHRSNLQKRLVRYAPETAERLLLGAAVSDDDLRRAHQLRTTLTDQLDRRFAEYDLLLTASAAGPAPSTSRGSRLFQSLARIPALPFNLTGHPAIHVPTALAVDGMPVGVQLIGPRLGEAGLLRAAYVVEQASAWPGVARPELS